MRISLVLFFFCFISGCSNSKTKSNNSTVIDSFPKAQISFSFDDPQHYSRPLLSSKQRDSAMLAALEKHKLQAVLYVCGKRVDDTEGQQIIQTWNDAGHIIGNHSYSHYYFHSPKISIEVYQKDFLRGDSLVHGYSNFQKIYRFPFLKQGDTKAKRDNFRNYLKQHQYRIGYVSIDASDWYICNRLTERLKTNADLNLKPYREFYIQHIWQRAQYYDLLAKQLTGRQIRHNLLLHHNLVSALFLDELIQHFKDQNWQVIDAAEALKDPIYNEYPDVLPAGESIVWSLAKEKGGFDLRYPAEAGEYEKFVMDSLGL